MLFAYARRRQQLPFRHLYWLFGVFIVGCGFTHFMEVLTAYYPMYRLAGLLKLITALASWGTVLALFQVAPQALAMRMPEELEREIESRKEAEASLQKAKAELEQRVEERTRELMRANAALRAEILERQRAQESVASLNQRLQRSMRETHHRVKNNLQVVAALLDMQAMAHGEVVPIHEITRLRHHVKALSTIHDLLTYQAREDAEVDTLSVKAAFERLIPLIQAMAEGREITYTVDDMEMPVRQSTALVMLSNELVSNALKHGQGSIQVRFVVQAGSAMLEVTDDGPGFAPGFDPVAASNTGLDLIESLARYDLNGTVNYENSVEGGARVRIQFPLVRGERAEGGAQQVPSPSPKSD